MKPPLRLRVLVSVCASFFASMAFAQTATFTSDTNALAAGGGTVTLTATTNYDDPPGALGWSIELPADWALVSTSGPNVPAISPEPGSSGTLEFAFTTLPAQRAEFTVQVRYPANAATARVTSTVLVRGGGKLTTLTPPVVELRSTSAGSRSQGRN